MLDERPRLQIRTGPAFSHMEQEVEMREKLNEKGFEPMLNKKYNSHHSEDVRSSPERGNFYSVSIGGTVKESRKSLVKSPRGKNTYILISILAAALNATGQIVRGYESKSEFATNFLFATTWLIIPLLFIAFKKVQAKQSGGKYYLPWYTREEASASGKPHATDQIH